MVQREIPPALGTREVDADSGMLLFGGIQIPDIEPEMTLEGAVAYACGNRQ
jgi:hypothetical protein